MVPRQLRRHLRYNRQCEPGHLGCGCDRLERGRWTEMHHALAGVQRLRGCIHPPYQQHRPELDRPELDRLPDPVP